MHAPAEGSLAPPSSAVLEARARVAQLRAEAELTHERAIKAALLYEAGYLTEMVLMQPAQAVSDYLAAYNADPRSRLPLRGLVRMFERRRSYKNLTRLYDVEVRTAKSAAERGSALVDQAVLSTLLEGDTTGARALLEQALEHAPNNEAALLYEWNRRMAGDEDGARRALALRAEGSDDSVHRGALWLELASAHEARGALDEARLALRKAALVPEPVSEVYADALARFARAHGHIQDLVEACEHRAEQLYTLVREHERDRASDPSQLEGLRARAVAHFYEAARLRCMSLGDPLGALPSIERARAITPDDPLFRYLQMLAYDLLEDRERAAEEARALLNRGVAGEPAAALHFRMAEQALTLGDVATARDKLVDTIAVAGGSVAAEAILDDLLLDEGLHGDRIGRREALANGSTPARALLELCEAAQIAGQELRDADRAARLFARADALQPDDPMLLREAYGSALDLNDAALARFALPRLLTLPLADDERAALLLHQLELSGDEEQSALFEQALERPEQLAPLLKLALLGAAERREYPKLARIHEALAKVTSDAEEAATELCAAARAWLRAKDLPRTRTLLERALEQVPTQRYALTLLEEVLREQGDADAAIELLRGTAPHQESPRDTELHLLSAGHGAELSGDLARAAQSYRQALDEQAPALGPSWALLRLAQRKGDRELERTARLALVARERSQGRAGVDTVLLAEHYETVDGSPHEGEPLLQRALGDDDVGHHAALTLTFAQRAPIALRAEALELLATRATDSLRPALLRELGGALIAHGAPPPRVRTLIERIERGRPDDRWAAFTRTHLDQALEPDAHAAALAGLAIVTTDPQVASVARAEQLWALARAGVSLGEALPAVAPDGPLEMDLAHVVVALASPAHERAERAEALETIARGSEATMRPEVLLALARARLAHGDAGGAIEALEELLALVPDHLAGWELAHAAAHHAGNAALAADAAQHLAEALEGDDALALYEESAQLRMDVLDDAEGALPLYRHILTLAPEHALAYERLRTLYAQRDDAGELAALVRARAAQTDDPDQLAKLLYELAQRERARGELDAALQALDDLLLLDDEHLGGLALSAEIQTARGRFQEAVNALHQLADAPTLPAAQRRLAALGAADFLENKLQDRGGALDRLERLVELTPTDPGLHLRIADVAERHADHARAARALEQLIELESDHAQQALYSVRLGDLLRTRLGRRADAAAAYRQALEWAPDHIEAARSLLSITEDEPVVLRLESELRRRAQAAPRDPERLRALATVAPLKRDPDLAYVALSALSAATTLSDDEQRKLNDGGAAMRRRRFEDLRTLPEGELERLCGSGLDLRAEPLLRRVMGAAAEIDSLTPVHFNVGRAQRLGARDPHPLRDELSALAVPLGLTLGDLYIGGSEPARIVALPREELLDVVIGSAIASPLEPALRYAAALQLTAARFEALPLLTRAPGEAALLVHAALVVEGVTLPGAPSRDALADLSRTLGKTLPRKLRKTLPDLARALPADGADLTAACRAALARVRRAALLVSGELEPALREADEDVSDDLRRAWLSAPFAAARKKVGLGP